MPYNSNYTGAQVDEAVRVVTEDLGTASTLDAGVANGVAELDSDVKVPVAQLPVGTASGVAGLDSGGKVPLSQLPTAVAGALSYQGTWNASSNSPTLASGTGTKGYYYVVSVAGTTTIDTVNDWEVGDWIVFNGTIWQKIDNTEVDATTSVKGNVKLANDLAGTAALPEVSGAAKAFAYRGVITPSISAQQDDWAPSGLADASIISVSASGLSNQSISGLTGGAAGRIIIFNVPNASSKGITILNESSSSTAANRFTIPGAVNLTVAVGSSVAFFYDSGSSRWKPLSGTTADSVKLSGDLTNTQGTPRVKSASVQFAFSGVTTPTQITSDQNDYGPTGATTSTVLRVNSDAARSITGLAGANTSGTLMIFENTGSFTITLVDESASSTAANRFSLNGVNIGIEPKAAQMLIYDGTSSRWRLFGLSFLPRAGGTISGALTVSGLVTASASLTVTGRLSADKWSNTISSLTYGATTDLDFDGNSVRTLSLTGDVTFTTSNRAVGRMLKIYITCDATPRVFTFPGWTWLQAAPTGIAANKKACLTLECVFGTGSTTDIVATYAEQP